LAHIDDDFTTLEENVMTLARYSRRFRRRPHLEVLEGRTHLSTGVLNTFVGATGR